MKRIWRKMQKMVASLCILCMCGGINVQASLDPLGALPLYEDGDVVGIIGDSITYVQYGPISYVEALYHYYLSQFPERKIEFRNLGAAGYKASDVLNIYDRDPAFHGINKAIMMLGMNEAILEISPEEYIGGIEEIVNKLKADGLDGEDILVLAPTPYDDMCALNYDRNGNPYWLLDHSLTDFTEQLEQKTVEWGVQYVDLHTPMRELTAEIQKENPKNTLTRGDCIHPSSTGQMLMAYYILRAQGAMSLEAGTFVPSEGEAKCAKGEITDFYRGERGMSWIQRSDTLPAALTEEFREYLAFFPSAASLYEAPLQIENLKGSTFYQVSMGETTIGNFTGEELAEGINLALLETHPLQEVVQQMEVRNRELHQKAMEHRAMWIDLMMGTAEYTEEEIEEAYNIWRAEDTKLRDEMYTIAQEATKDAFYITVVEEGYSVQELEQEKAAAKKAAAERIMKGIQEKIDKAAAVQAEKEQESQGKGILFISIIVFSLLVIAAVLVYVNKKRQNMKSRKKHRKKERKNIKNK